MTNRIIEANSKPWPRSDEVDAGVKAKPSIEAGLRKRLKYAGQVIDQLSSTARVPRNTRPILARNLGYMFTRTFKSDDSGNLSKIFHKAFGEVLGESHFKKRKRYIRLDSDGSNVSGKGKWEESYVAAGRDYLNLARAIGTFDDGPHGLSGEEKIQLSVLRLIEGTTYDDRRGMSERRDIEQRNELQLRLDQLVGRVVSRVDLDWMRIWSEVNPIDIDGRTGAMETVSLSDGYGWGSDLNITENIYGECDDRIVPCIRLGNVFTQHRLDGVCILDVSAESTVELGEKEAVSAALKNELDLVAEDEVTAWPDLRECVSWVDSEDIPDIPFRLHVEFYFRRFLDIEIRYDPSCDRWRLCILLRPPRHGVLGLDLSEDIFFLTPYFPESGLTLHYLGCEGESKHLVFAQSVNNARKDVRKYVCFTESSDQAIVDKAPDYMGLKEGCLIASSKEGSDFLLGVSNHEESILSYVIETCPEKYSPASYASIAGAILRNLAYAPEDSRIDNLLIQDARRRYGLVRGLAQKSHEDYGEAIKRIDENTT